MADFEEVNQNTVSAETSEIANEEFRKKGLVDYFALALSTCGVGYIPVAPGTFGSIVGVLIYLCVISVEAAIGLGFSAKGWRLEQISLAFFAVNLLLLLALCLVGFWASKRTAVLFGNKDPQKVVIDEVMGQLVVFFFIPFGVHWGYIIAGFLVFRLFDIWKPYPIRAFEVIPDGIGICADDLVAGVYGGICLAVIYAVSSVL